MGKFGIFLTLVSVASLGAGWLVGSGASGNLAVKNVQAQKSRTVLTALDTADRAVVDPSLWVTLDSLEDEAEFSKILEPLDADTLVGILNEKPRWTSGRWYRFQREVTLRLGALDPERALKAAETLGEHLRKGLHHAAFAHLAATLDPAELTARHAAVEDPALRKYGAFGITAGLAKIDPQRALTFVESQPNAERPGLFSAVYSNWAKHDPAAASVASLAIEDTTLRQEIVTGVISEWSSIDETAAMNWAKSIKNGALRSRAVSVALSHLASTDPQRAASELLLINPGDIEDKEVIFRDASGGYTASGNIVSTILKALGANTPASVDFLLSLPAPVRDRFIASRQWYGEGIEAGLALAEKLPQGSASQVSIFSSLIPKIPYQQSLKLLDRIPSDQRPQLMPSIISKWIEKDAAGAFQFLSDHPKTLPEWGGINSLSVDPEKAGDLLARLEKLPPEVTGLARIRKTIVEALFRHDPASAMEEARTDPKTLTQLAAWWASHDPAALDAWLQTQGDGQRAAVLAGVIKTQLQTDPKAAAAQLVTISGLELDQKTAAEVASAARKVAEQLAARSFPEAGDWIESLQPGGVANVAAYDVAERWAAIDAVAVSAWIRELPAGSMRDSAANALVEKISRSDPGGALTWTESIADTEIRDNTIEDVIDEVAVTDIVTASKMLELATSEETQMNLGLNVSAVWLETDPTAARAWIDNLPPGRLRDGAGFALLEPLMDTDLPAAFRMADELGNDMFFQEFVGYEDEDPKAFRAAVEGLPEGARRTELMKLIK